MRLVRLSQLSALPRFRQTRQAVFKGDSESPSERTLSTPVLILIRILTTLLLVSSIVLTILVLLLPTPNLPLSTLIIHPNGKTLDPTAIAPLSGLNTTVLTDITQSEGSSGIVTGAELRSDKVEVEEGVVVSETEDGWLGSNGPTVWIGVMRVCSRTNLRAEIICTSVSGASYHIALLPPLVETPLQQLPNAPRAPILLVISGLATLAALSTYLVSLVRWQALVKRLSRLSCKEMVQDRGDSGDTDSMRTLVDRNSFLDLQPERSRTVPRLVSLSLSSVALGFGIAACILQGLVARDVKRGWTGNEAKDRGMVIEIGSLLYLLPCIPLLIILSALSAYTPFFHSIAHMVSFQRPERVSHDKSQTPTERETKRSSISSKLSGSVQIVKTPEEAWSTVIVERPKEVVTFDSLEREGRAIRGVRHGWRESVLGTTSRMGMGIAV